jgi:predicted enzyme related to lactoylglutathione lyase
MGHRLVWAILLSRDVRSTMRFYEQAAGWWFEALPEIQFPSWVAKSREGELIAAFVDASGSDFPDAPELWLPHFVVDDIDVRIRKAEENGATILREAFDVAGFGRVAVLRQPGGGIVAWRTPFDS